MALVITDLIDAFIAAETDGIELTPEARAGVEKKCQLFAQAIDAYIKSADVIVDIPPGQVTTCGFGPGATTAPHQGMSSSIYWRASMSYTCYNKL